MRVEQEELVFSQKAREDLGAYEIPLGEGETELGPIQAKIRRFPMEKGENYKNINKMLMIMKINSATIVGGLIARNRKAGDRIQINGMNKSVRKLLCDSKLSADRRARIPVIADSEGILWVPGVGLCDRARPREGESFFTMEFQWNKDRNGDPTATVLSEYTVPTVGTEESDQQA